MKRNPAVWARVGAGVTVLAASALIGAPTAAYAADPLPDVFVSFDRDPVADVDNTGATVGTYVYNYGEAPASAVTLTFDLSNVADSVVAEVPEWAEQCERDAATVTCAIGQLDAGQVDHLSPLILTSRQGATPGPAGEVTVTIDGAEDDANPGDDSTTFPVTVIASGASLVSYAEDVSTEEEPVGPGDQVPFIGAIGNVGDSTASGATLNLSLSTYTTVVERYSDCTYYDYYPDDEGGEYVYGPSHVVCPLPDLEPGDGLLLFDPESGESIFTLTFGRNMPGPTDHYGYLDAQLEDQSRSAKGVKGIKGNGPKFADTVKKLRAGAATSKKAATVEDELDELDSYADFRYWSKKNTLDVRVEAKPISGEVGSTVDLSYQITNEGPSDGGGPSVLITAPTGTALLPNEWCYTDGTEHEQRPESAKLRCNFESEYPTVKSGYGKVDHTVQLRIKSTPGDDGTIYGESCCVGSTDSDKSNNTAAIVFATDGEGGGGGLPVTGAPVGLVAGIGGAVVALGLALMVVFRRRRLVLQVPQD